MLEIINMEKNQEKGNSNGLMAQNMMVISLKIIFMEKVLILGMIKDNL